MNADDLIQKYISETISEPELGELRTLLKNDQDALHLLIDEVRLSESLEGYFQPDRGIDIISLLSDELKGELPDDELQQYAAARGKNPEEYIAERLKNKKSEPPVA